MRTIISLIVLMSVTCLAAEDDIFYSRGLRHGKCYRENVKYDCDQACKKCTVHLFPDIRAQLSFAASDLEDFCKQNKSDTGLATFKVLKKKDQISLSVYGFIQVKKELSEVWTGQSNLKLSPVSCPLN